MLYLKNILLTKKTLLKEVTFSLNKDECIGLSGPSGSGKTLLLRAISDLDKHKGQVFLDDKECHKYSAPRWRKQVGFLTAENHWWHNRVGQHFIDETDTTLIAQLSQLGLDKSILNSNINHCSTGEKQRLALLRLLQNQPKVLLLDEPTSGMDPATVTRVEAFLSEYRRLYHIAILWISHDPQQLRRIADKHFQIENGELIEAPRV